MPCDTVRKPNETKEQRVQRVMTALRRLEVGLTKQAVKVVIGPQGAATFTGWTPEDREGVTDVCAFRALTKMRSAALAQAVRLAEIASGRRVDMVQVERGVHSHDGGRTWGTH